MKILITGATGFIGNRLVRKLAAQSDHHIRCLVRPSSQTERLKDLDVELVQGDLLEVDGLQKAVADCDMIYHLAANAHPSSVIPYRVYQRCNVDGTNNLLKAAATLTGLQKVVVLSSIAATGPSRDGKPLDEKSLRLPITNYGKSKMAVEDLCQQFSEEQNLPVVVIRPSMVYGIGDTDWLEIFHLIKTGGIAGMGVPIPGKKENLFDFCYVDNLVDGVILAANAAQSSGKIYFISDERSYQIKEIIQAVADASHVPYPSKFWPVWLSKTVATLLDFVGWVIRQDMPLDRRTICWMTTNYWVCDISKAKDELGFRPSVSLAEGVRRTFQWYLDQGLLKS